ncbi:hypothetical protein WG936_08235 [Corynebacterium sp. H127]|uniref:hypothetical protein n=1 Tax=Corynebacterium sp. H127 TaxID=3133418 RepID=UPI0030AA5942
MVKIYPADLPPGIHPMVQLMAGMDLTIDVADKLARHLFDVVGCRFHQVERQDHIVSFAVSWPRDAGDRHVAKVGEALNLAIPGGDQTAVAITAGYLPPGIKLEKHTGTLVGIFTRPGLYEATITVGTRVKWDPIGTDTDFHSAGSWIPIEMPRDERPVDLSGFPITVDDLDDYSKSLLLSKLLEWERAKAIEAADHGN